ncbi:cullin-9 isoform X2 [Mixophyes fleayi]|uniref:cullin-9 isoform X2 n=1 Tax=Mixophyes fleayi TaxID=3061075 RepID=UPI003F4E25B3
MYNSCGWACLVASRGRLTRKGRVHNGGDCRSCTGNTVFPLVSTMLVGERRNGNLMVQLGPTLQAQPEELLRQRWSTDGHIEYLIRWAVQNTEEGAGNSGMTLQAESKSSNILMWMSAEEVYTNCPTLLGKRKPEGPGIPEEKTSGGPDEGALQEMTEDVRMLVQRATRQMSQSCGPDSSILNTIHVLSAYASIGSLAGVFKETGALDLLMKMLCNPEKPICKNAGKMLRALASHDAGSRAHVLLSLSQQDGIEQHMDFESRYTLLQLFAETTSSEEHCISFDGIHLPQIPGKQLFSLVKRYLCVTSLLDQLSSDRPDRNNKIRLQHLFDFSMAMGSLICELVRVMGWVNEQASDVDVCRDYDQPRVLRSIFQPKVPSCSTFHTAVTAPLRATATKKKSVKQLISPSDFESHNDYIDYIQEVLKPGMSVRMLEDYDEISAGDEGVFRQSNNGMPPVQVLWRSTGRTYWVHWQMLEIIDFGDHTDEDNLEKASSLTESTKVSPVSQTLQCKPSGGIYTLPYLGSVTCEERGNLRQDEWWEILFFVRKLEPQKQQEAHGIIMQNLEDKRCDQDEHAFMQTSVSVDVAQKILSFLNEHCRGCVLRDLHSSSVYTKYVPHPGMAEKQTSSFGCSSQDNPSQGGLVSKKTKSEESHKTLKTETLQSAEQSDLQLLNTLLSQEGLQIIAPGDEKSKGFGTSWGTSTGTSLEMLVEMLEKVKKSVCGPEALGFIVQILQQQSGEEAHSMKAEGRSSNREKIVKMLVEILTNQMKEKLLVVTCLQLTYVVMSKYDWRVLFATEGGVRAVLGCMQEHQSSAAVQHIGLAVLKVLTGTGCCDLRGSSRRYTLNPSDVQVIKEIFSSIGSAASASSISLLRAIACAIGKMLSTPGCFTSVHNGLLVVRMLTENHKGLSEQLSSCELPSVLQSVSEDSSNSMYGRLDLFMQKQLCDLLKNNQEKGSSEAKESAQVLTLQEMDLPALLSSLKDGQMCRELLPSLERCVFDDVSSLRCDVSQLLTDPDFFLQLLSSLEQLRSEKHLQLCVYRLLNKCLDFYQEDALPWHKSIEPCLTSLGSTSSDQEVLQEVVSFLHRLASTNKDCAVVMCRLGAKEMLSKVLEKQNSSLLQASELKDLLTDCDKYANLYQKMATSILAGCIQMVLGQIEEHRRSQQQINIPFFDVFLRNLCQGSSVEVKEDKCWEKIEVSSNPHRANKLTDGNSKSYWESSGSTGSHYINIYMHRGVVIRQLVLIVASEDSSYMPARVVVMGGENVSSVNTELNAVNISSAAGRVVLIENVTRFWPIIQVKIKRCQQGGIDTRVRGLEVLGPKPTFWPVFKEQLCRRTFLFYTSRAHSWGQEICDKKEHLLQLFGRLNRALSHEQEFAERFLPDDEAAQALGRMCWEALITPLVQSITTSDSEGVSSLSWLLTRYLENIQLSRRPKSRTSVFNSRVRRLTHLLVHVDNSPPDTVELKPPSKINGKSRDSSSVSVKVTSPGLSSMAGIAQCWQGVVQKQVQRFLEVSWNDVDLVPRFCSLYLSLRRAMEEMFGQQTRFLLSLRQGFCEGLLQLSFLTAIHVTEQFARYIDQRIITIRDDSSDLQSLEHLQQFLEFILFLSELELANSFEHFYRHYLADRLLTLGPCWLENSVVDHIGICFPNRFPQEMLKNLQEANILQREEHLFRLQELDEGLLSEEEEEEGMVMEENMTGQDESGEDVEVQISVLSPRCWPISFFCYMADPIKYFPENLNSSLQHFTDFYTKSQSVRGSDLAQSRRLQWTWLGNAEIQYGDLTLRVSTLQMFILLLFNQQEEVLEEAIVQSTGLAEILVSHALAPLTAKGSILAPKKKGLLCLNEEKFIAQGPGKVFQLLPRQTYLNVEEDEGRILEKKRNIILCLIMQIMKEEHELHIDNLVFRVIESCQKSEFGKNLKFLNFSCSHTDVLSCIMYLISQGYARRGEDSPHIIEYLSKDPSTPHKGKAHISFQSSSKKKQDMVSKPTSSGGVVEQAVLESVLLPMGCTLSQEEVWALMCQMVNQVSETLSVSQDTAQHLLIHCKWNMDLLLQKYTDDPEVLLTASGLEVQDPQHPESPQPTCPVCMSPLSPSDSPPSLCCKHCCCKNCWNEYLTTRIEQNLVLTCTCPTTDCLAQPTSDFIRKIISSKEVIEKYEKALMRGFVESCSNLTWCTNPQGCDRILCKEGLGTGAACAKCSWLSCFNCSFPEAHYPASCSHMSQWMDDGGFYEGMTVEAQSKHLTKLISKHCPSCQAPIEKNEGCLHMTCAKCNHGFCWRCLKPWKPTHKDYYNCSAMVSKAARQEKRFQDYNEKCTFQHQAKDFAISLRNRLCVLNEEPPLRTLTFVITACRVLEMSRKVLGYSCVYSYYNQDSERLDVLEAQTENLEFHVNALQILLEYSLLQSEDLACSVRLLPSDKYNSGLELVRKVQERLNGILQHSTQDFRVGFLSQPDDRQMKASNVPEVPAFPGATDTMDGASDSGDTAGEQEEDDDYVPEWQEEYDDDLDEDDFSYDEDDASENLEPDSFIFEDFDGEAYE